MSETEKVIWDRKKLARFKAAFRGRQADDVFEFDGEEYVASYAKYLAEYLDEILVDKETFER